MGMMRMRYVWAGSGDVSSDRWLGIEEARYAEMARWWI